MTEGAPGMGVAAKGGFCSPGGWIVDDRFCHELESGLKAISCDATETVLKHERKRHVPESAVTRLSNSRMSNTGGHVFCIKISDGEL